MSNRILASAVALSFLVIAACESSEEDDSDGDAGDSGRGGSAAAGSGGSAGSSGGSGVGASGGASAGASGGDALGGAGAGGENVGGAGETGGGAAGAPSSCSDKGEGTLEIEIVGLPGALDAQVTVEGPDSVQQELESSATLTDVAAGSYRVSAARVTAADPIVRTVYAPAIAESAACVEDGRTRAVTVTYSEIPSGGKLWTSNLVGIPASELAETGTSEAAVVVGASAGKDVAFDRDGNLWSVGATTADPLLVRFPARELGSSGNKEPDRAIDLPIVCLPAIRAITFDASGNLWVSACGGRVMRLAAASLADSGEIEPDVVLSELEENGDIAFDADGDLWITLDGAVARYDAARLGSSTSEPADRVISARDAEDARDLTYSHLAFDESGNLWGFDFGGNFVFQTPKADLGGSGDATVVSAVSVALPVTVLLNRGAFDESGGLWISYAGTRVARLTAEQLTVSSSPGDPSIPEVLVTQGSLDTDLRFALYPAPAGLPLYHSVP